MHITFPVYRSWPEWYRQNCVGRALHLLTTHARMFWANSRYLVGKSMNLWDMCRAWWKFHFRLKDYCPAMQTSHNIDHCIGLFVGSPPNRAVFCLGWPTGSERGGLYCLLLDARRTQCNMIKIAGASFGTSERPPLDARTRWPPIIPEHPLPYYWDLLTVVRSDFWTTLTVDILYHRQFICGPGGWYCTL